MAHSSQITQQVVNSPNPNEMMFKIWEQTRYLVSQKPAADDYLETTDGYYLGRAVIPGPKAEPRFGMIANVNDYDLIRHQYYIRFIDSATTDNAENSISEALFTVMTPSEADEYEAVLEKLYPKQ